MATVTGWKAENVERKKNPTQRNPLGRVLVDQLINADRLRRHF